MNKSSIDYMLSCMTIRYHSMILKASKNVIDFDGLRFLDFCVNFLNRDGFVVYYDEVKHKYVIAK